MNHSEQCNCAECYVKRQQTPPAPVAQPTPEGLILEFVDPGTTAGQLRDDDGRFATQEQAIRQLNSTVKELGEKLGAVGYDLTALCNRIDNHLDGMAQDTATLRTDMARSIAALREDLSQLTGELETMKSAGAAKSKR